MKRAWLGLMLAVGLSAGCQKKDPDQVLAKPSGKKATMQAFLDAVENRKVPDSVQSRFQVKMDSDELDIHAPPLAGGLVMDQPGKLHLAVMAPVTGPVLTVTSDGTSAAMMNRQDKEWVVVDDLTALLSESLGADFGAEQLVGIFVGDLPLTDAQWKRATITKDTAIIRLPGVGGGDVRVVMDANLAVPREITVTDKKGLDAVVATYEPFMMVDEYLMPSALSVQVPSVQLQLDLRFKSWQPGPVPASAFQLDPPSGFDVMTVEQFLDRAKAQRAESERTETEGR